MTQSSPRIINSSEDLEKVGVCVDCQSDILMSGQEQQWWEEKIAESERKHEYPPMCMPKRCITCRGLKKATKSTRFHMSDASNELEVLITHVETEPEATFDWYDWIGKLKALQVKMLQATAK